MKNILYTLTIVFGLIQSAGTLWAESPRVLGIEILDEGEYAAGTVGSLSVDLHQGLCGEVPDETDEPFYDSVVATTIHNPLPVEVNVRSVRYRLRISKTARAVRSRRLAVSSPATIDPKSDGRVLSLFLKTDNGTKKLLNFSEGLATDLGLQHVQVLLVLRTGTGSKYRIRKRVSMAFGEYDRCEG